MRRIFSIGCFAFGCVLVVCALTWYVAAEAGLVLAPHSAGEAVGLFALYAAVMLPTLDRWSCRRWFPVIPVTPTRVAAARVVLSFGLVLCLASVGLAVAAGVIGSQGLHDHAFNAVIGSLGVMNGTYIALHWAYRPENLFGSRTPRALLNPLGPLVVQIILTVRGHRHRGSRHR